MKEKGEDWRKGRTIAEIKATYAPSAGAQQEIEKELRSKEAIARINYIRVTQSQAQEHIITQCQKRSNSWVKVQCILVTCIKALLMMLLGVYWKSSSNSFLEPLAQKRKLSDYYKSSALPNLMPQIAARFAVDFSPGGDKTLPADHDYKAEMEEALKLMIINEQKATWPKEYDQLQEANVVDTSSDSYQLNPIMEEDVIKMRTRLEYSQMLPEQTKFPIILPKKSRIADLIIMQEHEQASHAVPEQTRRNVRTKYWILGGKRKINTVLRKMCMNRECRKWQLKPLNQQLPPLPEQRMDLQCFQAISVDALGPIEMKICAECHHNAHCIKCEKKEKKSSDKKRRLQI